MTTTPAAALLDAARTLAAHNPASPAELAEILRALNDLTTADCVLGQLSDALDRWAELVTGHAWANSEQIADNLLGASERISNIAEFLDKARADTGHWNPEETTR